MKSKSRLVNVILRFVVGVLITTYLVLSIASEGMTIKAIILLVLAMATFVLGIVEVIQYQAGK